MARIARVIAPGIPHHVTQRGNRRQQTFFSDDDYRTYLALMGAIGSDLQDAKMKFKKAAKRPPFHLVR